MTSRRAAWYAAGVALPPLVSLGLGLMVAADATSGSARLGSGAAGEIRPGDRAAAGQAVICSRAKISRVARERFRV